MSNLRLKDHTWDAANVYDSALGKTQEQINAEVGTSLAGKQGTLVSGENIKTVNGASILGSGNIEIQGGGGSSVVVDDTLSIAGAAADAKKTGDEIDVISKSSIHYPRQKTRVINDLCWVNGTLNGQNGQAGSSTTRMRSTGYVVFNNCIGNVTITVSEGYKLSYREYKLSDLSYIASATPHDFVSGVFTLSPQAGSCYRFVAAYTDDGTLPNTTLITNVVTFSYDEYVDYADTPVGRDADRLIIFAGKQVLYTDGTPPRIEWYLVGDPKTRTFYKTKDFRAFDPLFNLPFSNYTCYTFGITSNDDIVVLFDIQALQDTRYANQQAGDDDCRRNPYVLLKSEEYEILHEIDFGESVKPTGWLSNYGFLSFNDGSFVFCEYTRTYAKTANAWRVSGDITDPENWVVTKTFELSGLNTGMKHIHCIMQDPYTGYLYMSTGDDDAGSNSFVSKNQGVSWETLISGSEALSRYLNIVFTEDYVYWATDSADTDKHYIYKLSRDANNVIDPSSVTQLTSLNDQNTATYALIYVRSQELLFCAERRDVNTSPQTINLIVYDLLDNTRKVIGQLSIPNDAYRFAQNGFRCRYIELNPEDEIYIGFSDRYGEHAGGYGNFIAGAGNKAKEACMLNTNAIKLRIFRVGSSIKYTLSNAM